MLAAIDKVTVADVVRIGRKVSFFILIFIIIIILIEMQYLQSKPAFVVYGPTRTMKLPNFQQVEKYVEALQQYLSESKVEAFLKEEEENETKRIEKEKETKRVEKEETKTIEQVEAKREVEEETKSEVEDNGSGQKGLFAKLKKWL